VLGFGGEQPRAAEDVAAQEIRERGPVQPIGSAVEEAATVEASVRWRLGSTRK
jgi:hypothetical protein